MRHYKKGKNKPINMFCAVVIALMIFLSTIAFSSIGDRDESETIRINEIMYNSSGPDSGHEWIEIYNRANYSINITSWRLFEQGVNHTLSLINGSMEIPVHGFAIIADNYQNFLVDYPSYSGTLIDTAFSLSNSGEYLAIKNEMAEIVDDVTYVPKSGANDTGMSLENKGNDIWQVSLINGGTPGAPNSIWEPPDKPTDPDPENNSVNVSINPIISVHVTDPDNDTMNVTFYNASDQSIIGVHPNVPNGSRANVTWSNLTYNTTYSWYAIANDSYLETKSDTWNFTTIRENHPPNKPSDPEPANESTDISIDVDLSWTGGDPDGDPVTYDVYFGESSPPPLEVSNQSETTYEPGTLNYSTTYYWRIVAWDSSNATNKSAEWWFTTEDEPGPGTISITITQPKEKTFYFQGEETFSLPFNTIVYGSLDIKVNVTADNEIDRVVFDIKGLLPKKKNVTDAPYTLEGWGPLISGFYTINVTAYDVFGNNDSDEIRVLKWRAHPVFLIAGTLVILKQLRSGTPFQWTILRGTVFNLRQVGNKFHGRAIRLQYREIAPFTSMASSGTIRLRKIAFSKSPFMFSYDVGPAGLTSYLFGVFPGKIYNILK